MRVCLTPIPQKLDIESERIIMVAIVTGLCVLQYTRHFVRAISRKLYESYMRLSTPLVGFLPRHREERIVLKPPGS